MGEAEDSSIAESERRCQGSAVGSPLRLFYFLTRQATIDNTIETPISIPQPSLHHRLDGADYATISQALVPAAPWPFTRSPYLICHHSGRQRQNSDGFPFRSIEAKLSQRGS
jgi:hypothetical protein